MSNDVEVAVRIRTTRTLTLNGRELPTDTIAVVALADAVRLVHAGCALAGDDRSVRLIARQLARQHNVRMF